MKTIYLKTKLIFTLSLLPFLFSSSNLTAQCTNTSGYGSYAAPASGVVATQGSQWQSEYNTVSGVVAGATYISSYSRNSTTYITVRSGSYNGAVVASGFAPLEWTASVSGTHYIHYNTNASCGTASSSNTSSLGRAVITTSCSTTFTDLGGGGSYGNNQTMIWKFYPSTPGDKVRVTFTSFSTENNYDGMMIYDGSSTASPLISSGLGVGSNVTSCPAGSWRGTGSPGVITSTAVDGALTFVFTSDAGTTAAGWSANITCFSPCATVAGTSSSSVTTSCGTVSTTLSLAGEGAGTIQWQQSTDGGANWTNIAGATTDPFVYSTNTTALFRAAVTNGCTSYSSTSSITFSCPDIIHPSSGTNSTTIQCGGSYTYRDPGNTNNYGNNQNGLITICPSTPGQYVNVNFTSFNTEGSFDYFYVFDGYDAHAPLLGVYDGNGALSGNVKATSSNSSGCLSFRFYSDGGTVRSGWEGTVTCSGTPSAIVPTTNPEDCQGAIVVCGDENLFGGVNSSGYNELPDPWNYCIAGGENQSTWYAFSPATSGTIAFEIIPDSPTDYDWAVWGPYASLECPAFNNDPTLRCSSSQLYGNGNTGLLAAETDTIEQNGEYSGCCGADGDGFLKPINAQAGEIYVLMLDNWDVNSVGFELHWNLTNGATLDCSPVLPVNLVSFTSLCDGNNTILNWVTETETNNDYFAIEKSDENFEFYEIGRISGKGNSNITNTYTFTDKLINENTSYYRLKQVDFDGKEHYHRIIASNCFKNSFDVSNLHLTDNKLDMIISSSSNEEVMIYLYSSTGKLIAQQKTTVNSGNNKFSLNDLNVNSGIYFVTVIGQQNKFSGKIVKE